MTKVVTAVRFQKPEDTTEEITPEETAKTGTEGKEY
jgi:hypothetical protein